MRLDTAAESDDQQQRSTVSISERIKHCQMSIQEVEPTRPRAWQLSRTVAFVSEKGGETGVNNCTCPVRRAPGDINTQRATEATPGDY